MADRQELTAQIKEKAKQLGFPLVGITTPEPPAHLDFFQEWCAAGYNGVMDWIGTPGSRDRRSDPRLILPECESILVLGIPYLPPDEKAAGGKIASYALNQDYHDVLLSKLERLVEFLEGEIGKTIPNRFYTDTGPVMERELAQRAGLGWIGKNTLLINQDFGSYFLLAEILLGIDLAIDPPIKNQYCGSCTRCLEACPTGCLITPYTLDATRCISYLTIEYREMIPADLRPLIGNQIFGCDICQGVCPWNRSIKASPEVIEEFHPRDDLVNIDLVTELELSREEFSTRFKGSPVKRTKRRGYLRNIAVALGNQRLEVAIPALSAAMMDKEPLVRAHAAWALGEIGGEIARQILEIEAARENESLVKEEIQRALNVITQT